MSTSKRRTRIAHVTTVHHAQDPRILHKELATLSAAGFEAHLIAPHSADEVKQGVVIHALPRAKGQLGRLRLMRAAFREARQLKAALYHLHDPELIPLGYALKRATGARVVYDMHEDYRCKGPARGRLVRALERWGFAWADHVVVANPAHAAIPAASGAAHTIIANYYQSPDASGEAERPPLGDLRLVCTGVLSVGRGLLNVIDLAALVQQRQPRWRLDLTGVCYLDADRQRAERRLRQCSLGGSPALRRTGWEAYVPHRTIMRHTHAAHVGLFLCRPAPQYLDVLPTKFYEYLSAGLPVLCSDFPLYRAFVERHGCGAVVPPGDAEAAFAVLRRWTEDPARYKEKAAAARAAAPQYQWPAMGRRLVRLYEALLA